MTADRDQPSEVLDERFRRALDSILDLVVVERAIRDAAGEIIDFQIEWMNNAPIDVAGRPREELIGRRISELYPVLAGGELIDGYRRVVDTGEPLVVEVMPYEDVIDGRPVSGFYTVQASKFEDGVLVASRDVTALEGSRRELEVALQELEAAQRLAQLGTWRLDLASGRIELSRELRRMYGITVADESDVQLLAFSSSIHREDRRKVATAYEAAIGRREAMVVDHRVVNADGSIGYVRSYAEPIVDGDQVVGMWGTTQDITDRVMSRDALDAEHIRRVKAEALAEVASTLSGVASRQAAADALLSSLQGTSDAVVVALGLVDAEDGTLRHYFGGSDIAADIEARYLITPLSVDVPPTRAVATGAAVTMRDRADQIAKFPLLTGDFDTVGSESAVALPLVRATGEVFGALTIAWAEPREFDADFMAMLRELAAVTARTTERLELLELERWVTHTLQLGLLALDVRSTQAIVRARYRAADSVLEIGGDWYDAVEIGDGRLAVAVGDVVGRGLAAATTMGQLRAALGVTSLQADDASDAVRILDRYAQHVPGALCATVAFALVDPANKAVSYAVAGHPPPLRVTPDGDVAFLDGGVSWPLGIETDKVRTPAAAADLPAGSLLLLYTDGLIERRGEPLDIGLARLSAVVREHWSLPLRRLKQAIFSALVADDAADDVALVAVRTVGASPFLFTDVLHARADELGPARRRLRDWLEDRGIAEDARNDLVLAIGEAVTNAIEHGSTREDQVVGLEIMIDEHQIVASVSDSGHWQPGIEGFLTGRGRGHLLMQALAADVDIDTDRNGTIVTLRFLRERQFA